MRVRTTTGESNEIYYLIIQPHEQKTSLISGDTQTYLDGEGTRNRAQQNASGRDDDRKLHVGLG